MTRIICPTEAQEQTWVFQWAATMANTKWPELALMYHIPNGGSRNRIEAARLKGQGVKPGIPDIFLPVSRGGYHGMYVEMKRQKGGTLSDDQKKVIGQLRDQGYFVEVCKGFGQAVEAIEAYMEGRYSQ